MKTSTWVRRLLKEKGIWEGKVASLYTLESQSQREENYMGTETVQMDDPKMIGSVMLGGWREVELELQSYHSSLLSCSVLTHRKRVAG